MSLKYYTDDTFLRQGDSGVSYGFFTRKGGVSGEPYSGLNCGQGSDDKDSDVLKNRELVAFELGVVEPDLCSPYQVHSPKVLILDEAVPKDNRPEADACVTDKPGLAMSVVTADCAPVLFYGSKKDGSPVVGAAHAGWQGAVHGVLDNVVSEMRALGAESIRACVGPCIAKSSYEVSEEFTEPFLKHNEESERFFYSAPTQGKLLFDLSGYCAWRLFLAEVRNVSVLDIDTYKNEDEFFSYRRMTHRGEKEYGRQISAIAIQKT